MEGNSISTVRDLRVLIVAEDPLARAGLAALMANQPGCTVVGQASFETGLASALEVYRPEAVVCDLGWDPVSSLAWLGELLEGDPPLLALLPDETHVAEARASGIRGLLLRDTDGPTLVAALKAVVQGLVALDPALTRAVLPGRGSATPAMAEDLTARETEVLGLMAEGMSNKAIASHLGISEHTVKFHVNAILSKLAAQSRTEAVIRATRLGLVML